MNFRTTVFITNNIKKMVESGYGKIFRPQIPIYFAATCWGFYAYFPRLIDR